MTSQHVEDGREVFDRIGGACDRIGAAGYPALQQAIAMHTRERRGQVQKSPLALRVGTHLMTLADEVERLADAIDAR